MVNTWGCGPLDVGSIPASHPKMRDVPNLYFKVECCNDLGDDIPDCYWKQLDKFTLVYEVRNYPDPNLETVTDQLLAIFIVNFLLTQRSTFIKNIYGLEHPLTLILKQYLPTNDFNITYSFRGTISGTIVPPRLKTNDATKIFKILTSDNVQLVSYLMLMRASNLVNSSFFLRGTMKTLISQEGIVLLVSSLEKIFKITNSKSEIFSEVLSAKYKEVEKNLFSESVVKFSELESKAFFKQLYDFRSKNIHFNDSQKTEIVKNGLIDATDNSSIERRQNFPSLALCHCLPIIQKNILNQIQ